MLNPDNPYSLAPVENPRLLRTRRAEIRLALDTVAPTDGSSGHALVCGPRRTGRTSTLKEVSRRAQSERGCLVVNLRLFEEDLTTTGLMRTFLSAAIEQLAALHDTEPDWYWTWCNRVLLRDQSPMGIGACSSAGSRSLPTRARHWTRRCLIATCGRSAVSHGKQAAAGRCS